MHTRVGIILGSRAEWRTMQHTAQLLAQLGISFETRVITANRNTNQLHDYASKAVDRGLEVIIAGSNGATPVSDILASKTEIPVVGVPIQTKAAKSSDSKGLNSNNLSCNPVDLQATSQEGAVNAALLAASMLGNKYPKIREKLIDYTDQEQSTKMPQEHSRYVA